MPKIAENVYGNSYMVISQEEVETLIKKLVVDKGERVDSVQTLFSDGTTVWNGYPSFIIQLDRNEQ